MALYYDNNTQHIPASGKFQPIERVYAIRFSRFTDAHRGRLDEVYQSLPEFVGYGNDGVPYWFGPEDSPPFLWASVEPSGLLVHGMLSSQQWLTWDAQFSQHLSEFPTFEVEYAMV
jgi:hypothetical protein